jgi:transposase
MSEHVAGLSRNQTTLFPDTLEEYVDKENPVRFIDAFIDSLNLEKLGFKHALTNDAGRPSYDPSDLLKLYVYGYLNQIRSSRKLERECHRNVEVMWLTKKLAPDFKTIADFRKDNVDCVKGVFKEFVKLCMGLDLYGAKLVAVDGVKFKAVNSLDKNFNRKSLSYRLKVIDERISKYISEMEEADRKEEQARSKHADLLEEKVKKLMRRKEEYAELLRKLKESKQNEVSLVDADSRLMKNQGKIEPCYNSHVAVDDKNHLIVDYNVTNAPADNCQLSSIAKGAKETFGVEGLDVITDKGFFNFMEIKECVDNGITPYVPEQSRYGVGWVKKTGIPTREFASDKFVYDEGTDAFLCPAGNRLEFSYLDRAHEKMMRVYRSDACFSCPFFLTKCTRYKRGRTVWRWEHAGVVEEMRERMEHDPEKLALRKKIVEHPFGTIKRAFNQGYLLLKGLRKVSGEVGFTMLAYNIRRVLNILGPKALTCLLNFVW